MAGPFYVDPAASGSANGEDWTNAWTTLQTALDTATAGEIIYCRGTELTSAAIDVDTNDGNDTSGFISVIGCNGSGNIDGTRYIINAQGNNVNGINIDSNCYWFQNIETKNTGTEDGFYSSADYSNVFINCCANNCTNGFYFSNSHNSFLCRCVAYSCTKGFYLTGYIWAAFCCAHGNTSRGFDYCKFLIGCLSYDNAGGFYNVPIYSMLFNCVADDNDDFGFHSTISGDYFPIILGCRSTNHDTDSGDAGINCNNDIWIVGWSYFEDNDANFINDTVMNALPNNDNSTTNAINQNDTNEGYEGVGNYNLGYVDTDDPTLRREAITIPTS